MSSTQVIEELFVGPAVVVDDTLGRDDCTMQPIIAQIEAQKIPVHGETTLPPLEEIRHWRNFSLIVLDWELFPTAQGAGTLVPGISLPDSLHDENDAKVAEFVKALLGTLYAPIFIFSSQSAGTIMAKLMARLEMTEDQVRERVMIRSKSDMSDSLFEALTAWVSSRPSIYALKSWDYGYEAAKKELFSDLHASSPNWPKVIWATSGLDSVNPHSELSETITRNILHRFQPLVFDASVFEPKDDGEVEPPEALRRVLHRQAVIASDALHDDVLMPGDFFFSKSDAHLPSEILINVTPACDLVPRGGASSDDIELTLVKADLIADANYKTKRQIEAVKTERSNDLSSSHLLYVLTDSARPYRVQFKSWSRSTWGALKEARRGRLLEPHITQLQQKFALYFHRQGLPRLPDRYFISPGEMN